MKEEFIRLLERKAIADIKAFIASHSPEEKKKFAPELKAVARDYLAYREQKNLLGSTSWGRKADQKQIDMLFATCLACLNKKDFSSVFPNLWTINKKLLGSILEWWSPDWFSDYLNNLFGGDFPPLDLRYSWLIDQHEKGRITLSPQTVAVTLPYYILEDESGERINSYHPERLFKRPVTMQEHFWMLFENRSNINYAVKIPLPGRGNVEIRWIDLIAELSQQNRIDRHRLLRETIHASNRNFNKPLSGWFAELLDALKLTDEEILLLQGELTSVLAAPHSKTIKTALQLLKKIVQMPGFDAGSFLDAMPALLTRDSKANISAGLTLMDKIARQHKDHAARIGLLACQVLINTDDTLQQKAAKLIAFCYKAPTPELLQELTSFQPGMLSSAKNILSSFLLPAHELPAENCGSTEVTVAETVNAAIPSIGNTEELTFFASQAFDNHQSWYADMLPASLIKLIPTVIKEEKADNLEPVLQRAVRIANFRDSRNGGLTDHLMSLFFIEVCIYLINEKRVDAPALKQQLATAKNELKSVSWISASEAGVFLAGWNTRNSPVYARIFQDFLLEALQKIRTGDTTPLLSTPTHEPGWLDPLILAQRWLICNKAGIRPGFLDTQLALSRCRQQHSPEAIRFVKEHFKNDTQHLLLFLFEESGSPQGEITDPARWLTASLSRRNKGPYTELAACYPKEILYYTSDEQWNVTEENYDAWGFDKTLMKNTKTQKQRKVIRIEQPSVQDIIQKKSLLSRFWPSKIKEVIRPEPGKPSIYEEINRGSKRFLFHEQDTRRALLMTPNCMDVYLSGIIQSSLHDLSSMGETDKRVTAAALQTVYDIHAEPGTIVYLLIGLSLLAPDKTVTALATEIWLRGVSEGSIDSARLGSVIGKLEAKEFAPLKRFTDAAEQHMLRVSTKHTLALQQLLENIIPALGDEAPANLRKLLELYNEVLSLNGSLVNEPVQLKLYSWENINSLQKIIARLKKKQISGSMSS